MQALTAGWSDGGARGERVEVQARLADGVEMAGLNGPHSTVISGDEERWWRWRSSSEERAPSQSFQVSHAFHSKRMAPMLDEFRKVVSSVSYGTPRLAIASNVTGRLATQRGDVQRGVLGAAGAQPGAFFGRRAGA